jgi:MFS family permease
VLRSGASTATGHRRVALAVLSVANSLVMLDGLVVAVALPAIQRALGFGPADLQWVVNAYVLCFGGALLLGGRLADLLGRRRMAVAGLLVFAAGSLLAGLAPSAGWLVAGRAVQGTGAAVLDPALLALLIITFPERRERNRALGLWSAAGSLGIPAGALLGGAAAPPSFQRACQTLTACADTSSWRATSTWRTPAANNSAPHSRRAWSRSRSRCAAGRRGTVGMDRILAWPGVQLQLQPPAHHPMALAGGCRFLPQAPARSYAGQPQGQPSDEGSGG